MKSETEVLREVSNYLREQRIFFWRSNNTPVLGRSGFTMRSLPKDTPKGLSDLCIVYRGVFIAMEVKRAGSDTEREKSGRKIRAGKLTPEQAEFGTAVAFNGGEYVCVRSVEDVKAFMEKLVQRRALPTHQQGTADFSKA